MARAQLRVHCMVVPYKNYHKMCNKFSYLFRKCLNFFRLDQSITAIERVCGVKKQNPTSHNHTFGKKGHCDLYTVHIALLCIK